MFVISLFGCTPALDARGRDPVCPPSARHWVYFRVKDYGKKETASFVQRRI